MIHNEHACKAALEVNNWICEGFRDSLRRKLVQKVIMVYFLVLIRGGKGIYTCICLSMCINDDDGDVTVCHSSCRFYSAFPKINPLPMS